MALPSKEDVVVGQAEFLLTDPKSLQVKTSDKAIINYESFDIGKGESVRFIQPSKQSTVLNRVKGGDPSQILGHLDSNGQVFLVNPNGIYFGPHATVNVGSLVVSTLNIRDEDFLQERYQFSLEPGAEQSSIKNDGRISASPEGFLGFLAPIIQNNGFLLAQAGKVVLASAEKVTLDFSGDGLIRFSLDGDLKQAVIENYGQIEAAGGSVSLSLRTAREAIRMVVNTDGIIPANAIEEVNGVIRLVCRSEIAAKEVHIEGKNGMVDVQGTIDVSNRASGEKGGIARILGEQVQLVGAQIDASGDQAGGLVFVGGDYQGKGELLTAQNTVMDRNSMIYADAITGGKGGKVILWADDTTLFDGKIYARGGSFCGDGGFVETSGKTDLGIENGFVDTSAPQGKFGDWLLDPISITIATGGGSSIASCSAPNCGNGTIRTIAPATIAASATNVALCARNGATSSITVTNAVTMSNVGVSLSLTAGSGSAGPIALNANLTTRGAAISLTGVVTVGAAVTLDTTNAGGSPAGGNISFSSTVDGAQALTLRAGTGGTVSFNGAVGGTTALTNLSFTSAALIQISNNIRVSGANPLTFPSPVSLTGPSTITSNNANISFGSTLNGAQALTIAGGSGTTTFTGVVGGTTALSSLSTTAATITQSSTAKTTGALSYTGSTAININGNITTSGGVITLTGPVVLTNTPIIDSTNAGGAAAGANISFSSTVNGATALTLRAGTGGTVSLSGAVGGTNALTNLSFTSANLIQIGSNITVTGANPLTFPSPVSLTGPSTITSNSANITFNSTLNGAQSLTLAAGVGNILFSGVIGGTTPLTGLAISSANNVTLNANATTQSAGSVSIAHSGLLTIPSGVALSLNGSFVDSGSGTTSLSGNITTNGQNITWGTPVTLGGAVVLNAGTGVGNISFASTLNGAQNLTLSTTGGNIIFTGAVGGITRLGTLQINAANSVTANALTLGAFAQVSGTGITTFNSAVNLNTSSGMSITAANVTFNNNLNTTNAGSADISVSGTLILNSSAAMTLAGHFTQSGVGGVQSDGSITTNNQNIQFTGPVTTLIGLTTLNTGAGAGDILFVSSLDGPGDLTLTAGTGNITFSAAVGSSTRLGALTINSANNISALGIKAASINQTVAATGTSTYTGDLNMNAAAGVSLNGGVITINGNLITTNSGPFSITNSGLLNLTAGASSAISGSFTQTGAGLVNFSGTILTSNTSLSFASPITLTSAAVLNSGTGAGSITLSATVDGAQTLSLASGTGSMTLSGNLGSTTRLGAITINQAGNVSTQAITAASLTQLAGTGTTTFNSVLDTNTLTGIVLTGSAFTFNHNVTTTASGPLQVTNSALLTFASGTTVNLGGGFSQLGSGGVSFAGSITAGDAISVAGNVTVAGTATLSTAAASKNITLSGTVNGGNNFTLAAGGGNILISGAVGGTTRLGTLTFSSANNVTASSITAASVVQSAGTGTTTFTSLNTNSLGGINLTLNNLSENGAIITTNGGSYTVANSGAVTLVSSISTSISGSFQQTGGVGAVNLSGTLTTINQPITFTSPITLTNDTSLSSGAGVGDITLPSVTGAHALTLTAGTGSITASTIGATALTSVTFTSASNITAAAITAGSITQSAGSGTSTFNGALSTSTASGISLTGTNFQFSNSVTASATGPFTLVNSGTATFGPAITLSISGALSQSGGGPVALGASITTSNGAISFASPITLNGASSLNSSAGNGNITLSSALDGAQTFSLAAGGGNISMGGSIGAANALSSLTAASANNISLANIGTAGTQGISGATSLTATADINFTGTNYNFGTSTFSGAQANLNAGALTTFATNGNPISFASIPIQLSSGTDLTINSGGGALTLSTLHAAASNLRTVILNSGSAAIQVGQIGSASNSEFASTTLNGGNLLIRGDIFSNALTLTTSGLNQIFLGGNITTVNNAVTFPVAVVRDTIMTATVSTSGGDITFSNTIDGDAALTRNLTLAAGSGNIILTGAVGSTAALETLTFSSVNNVTANAITAGILAQSAGTSTTTFNGAIATSNALGINLTGSAFTFNNTVATTNLGSVIINNSGLLSMPNAATCTISGPFSQTGSGAVQIGNSMTVGDQILFTSAVSLVQAASLSTAAVSASINFSSTIDSVGATPFDLFLDAGTGGNITISGNMGSIHPLGNATINHAQNITIQAITASSATINGGTGTTTVNGNVLIGSGGINVTGNNFFGGGNITTTGGGNIVLNNSGTSTGTLGTATICDGNYSQIGSGPYFVAGLVTVHGNLLITSGVTLFDNSSFDLSAGVGNMTFLSTIDGGSNLSLLSGGGSISISGNIGSGVSIGAFTINGAGNVTTQGIQATSILETAGTGTTIFNGPLTTSGAAGIAVAAGAITRGAAITTTGGGPLTITNSGTFTSTAAGAITLSGSFTQNGSGNVSFGGNLVTSNANISFASSITLAADTSLSSGTGAGGNITLGSTVQGGFGLTLNSGAANITLSGDVGTIANLTSFSITRAGNVSTQAIIAGSITQSDGSGTTTFNGALNTTALSGISLTGTSFTFNNTFTTTAAGPLSVVNTGVLQFSSGATGSLAGSLTQSGTGSTQLSSSITAGGAVQFNGAFSASGTGSLSTQAANQPITFFSTLDGPGNLILSSGTADITFSGNAGSSTSLGALTISTVRNFTAQAVTASSLTQSTGTGTTLFNGALATSGSSGISLTGTNLTFLQNVLTTGSGPITLSNSGALTTTAGKTISSNGNFTQNGSGSISLASSITTTNTMAANAGINFSGTSPITLTAPVSLDTSAGNGTITLAASSSIDGNQAITFNAGTGDINVLDNIGSTTRVGAVTFTSAHDILVQAITSSSITQLAGTGTTTLLGAINTNGALGINVTGNNFSIGPLSSTLTTTNGGSFVIDNLGVIAGSGPLIVTVDGSFIQSGPGPIYFGSITAHQGFSFAGPAIVVTDATLDSSGAGGHIVFNNTIDSMTGVEQLILNAGGAGDVTLSGVIGGTTPLGVLEFQNVNDVTASTVFSGAISTGSAMTGAANFNGAISTTDAAGIVLSGVDIAFNANVATTNTGPMSITISNSLTLGNGITVSLSGPFTQTGGTGNSFCGATVATASQNISFASRLLLTAASSFNSGGGNITFTRQISGAFPIGLTAGTGTISVQMVGQIQPLTSFTVPSAASFSASGGVLMTGALSVTTTGAISFANTVSAGSIGLTGGAISLDNTVNSTAGAIAITNSGVLTTASLASIVSNSSFTQTGAGTVSLGANITTSGTVGTPSLSIASPITMTNSIALDSGGGDLVLSGSVSGAFNLTVGSGTGDLTLSGVVGGPRIGAFTLFSARNISVQAITASSITQLGCTGTATLHGSLDTNTNIGISLTGNNFVSSGSINTTNGGPLTVTNSGLVTGTGASTVTLNGGGALTQNGTGPVNIGGTITTQGGNISHASAASVLLDTTFTSNGGNISFASTIDGPACLTLAAGAGNVILSGIVGGTTPLSCLTASGAQILQSQSVAATGAVAETGTTGITLGGGITTNGNDITLTGNVTTSATLSLSTSGGAGNITITGTANGNVSGRSLTIQTGSGNISLQNTIGGGTSFQNLTFSANNISWANLGSVSSGATGTVSLNGATNLTFTGTSYSGSTQNYTAGSNFNFTALSPITVTATVAPITFTTGTINLSNDLTLKSNGGNISMANLLGTGFNFTANADVGNYSFVQIGALGQNLNNVVLTATNFSPTPVLGSNVFAAALTVNSITPLTISTNQLSGNITYNQPVIFQGNITYSCGAAGTITFNSTVDAFASGSNSLTFNFNPCTGSLVFNGPVGSTAPLDFIAIDSSVDVTANNSVIVGSFSVANGTGTTALNSGITSTGASGVSLSSPTIDLAGSISTSADGPLTLDNSGSLTIASGTSFNISGPFDQTGAGSVTMDGSVVTADASISFTGPITITGPTTFESTVLTGGDISFASTIQGAQNLSITAGGHDVSFGGAVGTMATPINDLTIFRARDVTASAPIYAVTITQFAGTGTTSFQAVNTNGVNGIQLTGAAFSFNGNITTTSSLLGGTSNGSVIINNSGMLTFASGLTNSIAGALTQNGAGSNNLAGAFTTGGTVSFATAATLTGTTSFDSSANGQNITFSSTLTSDAMGPHNLTLNAGIGNIVFGGTVGATPLGAISLTSNNLTTGTISAASISQNGSGSISITGNLTTTGASGISLSGTAETINGTVTTTGTGPFTLTNSGSLTLTLGAGTSIDGAFTQSGGGPVFFSGTLLTNATNILFTNGVSISAASVLSTGSGAGNITFSSTLNSSGSLANLDLTAGTGAILFAGTIGASTSLGALTIHSANGITYPTILVQSLSQLANAGATTISGTLNSTGLSGIALSGTSFTQNGAISATGGGGYAIEHSGTYTMNANISASGGFTDSALSAGGFSLAGSVTTSGSPIAFLGSGTITLAGTATLNTGTGAGDITCASAITGAQALTLRADTGSITLSGNVGATPLTAFSIISGNNVSTQAISSASIAQLDCSGTTTFNGALNTTGASGISLTGNAITFNNTITTTGTGPLTISNNGLLTFNSGATGSIAGALTQNGTGSTLLSSAITAGGQIQFNKAVSVSGTGSLSTAAVNQPILFVSTLDGPGNLTLSSGAADITFTGNAGSSTSLGQLTVSSVGNWTVQAISAGAVTQSAGTGTTLFQGALNTDGSGGISLTGANFTFLENVTTTGSGPITLTNSGTLTTTLEKTFSSNGSFTQNGSGAVFLASTVRTTNAAAGNAAINFTGTSPITLSTSAVVDSSTGGGTITFAAASTVDGHQSINLIAGSGDININGAFGATTRLGAFLITSVNNLNVEAITADSITQLAGTGTSTLLGSLNTAAPGGISLAGNNFAVGPLATAITTTNGGSFTVTNQGLVSGSGTTATTVDGSFIQNGSGIILLGGPLTAHQGISVAGPAIFGLSGTLDTSAGNGNITFSNVVCGLMGTESLVLTLGTGDLAFSSPIGSETMIGPFAVTSLASLTASGVQISLNNIGTAVLTGITGTTSLTAAAGCIFTGTTYNAAAQTYTGTTEFSMNGAALTTFSSGGNPIVFQGGAEVMLSTGTDLTVNTGGGNLTMGVVHAQTGNQRHLVLNAGAGSIQIGDLGTSGAAEFASASFAAANLTLGRQFANSFTLNYTGSLFANGDIVSVDTALSFPNPVVLQATNIFSTVGASGADIGFFGTINGSVDDAFGLTLNAGGGAISCNANVGNTHRLSSLTINSAGNTTLAAPATMTVDALTQLSGTGTTTFNGVLVVPSAVGISLTGTNFTFNNLVQTLSNGSLTVTNSGTLNFAGTASLSGAFTQASATGPVTLSGSITAGQPIAFAGPVTLSGAPSLSTAAANQTITFQNTINGGGNITFASGGGDLILQANAGLTSRLGSISVNSSHNITIQSLYASSINVVSSTGTATVNGTLNTNGAAGATLVGKNFISNGAIVVGGGGSFVVTNSGIITGFAISSRTIDGSYTQNGTGPVNFAGSLVTHNGTISFASPVTLLAPSVFDSSGGSQNITFNSTIDGPGSLSASAGGGSINFAGNLGVATTMGAIAIPSANNVTMQIVNASSITQTAGSGTTAFNGNVTTSGSLGMSLTGTNFTRGANWTTTNGGPITLNNSGLFTSTAAGTISTQGAFTQSGAGSVLIQGSLNTNNSAISFAGPMTLAGNMAFNSGSGAGTITFSNTIDAAVAGAQTLLLAGGTGDILASASCGLIKQLGTVTITSANNVTFNGLSTTALSQIAGSGTTALNGTTNTSTLNGIQILTNAIALNGTITTAASGPIILTNGGLLTVSANCTVSGAFTQNGLGSSTVSGSISSGGPIFFREAVSTSGSPSMTTASRLITLSTTLDGPGNLTLNSGTANIVFGGSAGSATRLGALIFTNAGSISANAITAASIQQVAGSGTTTFSGNLNTNALLGINLNGTAFTINGSLITTGGGPVLINHIAPSTFTFGASTLLSDAFNETGTGTISLSGTLHASNSNITFANPLSLTNTTYINSDGGGDILISSTIDGAVDVDLTAGTGNITILANIGDTTPVNSFTVESANNVTTQAISAGYIDQVSGTGLTTFNGALTTSAINGISLTGNQFTFNAPVTTQANGPIQITNSALLTISSGAVINSAGSFSQLGSGGVSLADNITAIGNNILFTGPVALSHAVALNAGTGLGDITFSNTVSGANDLTLTAGLGDILFSQNVGTIGALLVNSAHNVTAQNIVAASINLTGISTQATIGSMTTSGASGIAISSAGITLTGNITTANSGPVTLTNSGTLTMPTNFTFLLDGPFLQNGTGVCFGGGNLTTVNNPVEFQTLLNLTGPLVISTGAAGANVLLSELEGAQNLTIQAGVGDVTVSEIIGDETALQNVTIASAHDISLHGVGTLSAGVTGTLSLTASQDINLTNALYSAGTQIYSPGHNTNLNLGSQINLTSFGGPITFTSGTIFLTNGNDLQVVTNNGDFSFVSLLGSNFENIFVNTGTGTAALNTITSLGTINHLIVNAGKITFAGPIDPVNTNFVSLTTISNAGAPVLIQSLNSAYFNGLGGDVGTLSSPIFVQSSNQIFAGADGHANSLADFNGSSVDNTVNVIPTNPPCKIIFNGVVIKDCTIPPSPPSPIPTTFRGGAFRFPFMVPGVESSYFNLGSDFFFYLYFLTEDYVRKERKLYYVPPAPKAVSAESLETPAA